METTFLTSYRKAQNPEQTHFCPGCGHGNILKFVDEAICSLQIDKKVIWVSPVGCGGLTDSYLSVSHILAAHGRASAVATAVKRLHQDAIVIASQGDGDLASIGLLEAIHAANRCENITVIFINNANFGMTGGQMAPTSLLGQHTATSPLGRNLQDHGAPLKICELLNQLEGPAFIARVALGTTGQLLEAKRILSKAIQNQVMNRGYSFVEVLSPCPSNWHCPPKEARKYVAEEMTRIFPLGVFRDESRESWQKAKIQLYTPESIVRPFNDIAHPIETLDQPLIQVNRKLSVCCAGFGGQGVLTIGRILSQIALYSGLNATWIPSYGPEMRGGVANCFVRISPDNIESPVVSTPDIVLALNQPSFDTFYTKLHPGGMLFYDSDCISANGHDSRQIAVPATTLASACDSARSANFVLLGSCLKHGIPVQNRDLLCDILQSVLKPDQIHAIKAGYTWNNAPAH